MKRSAATAEEMIRGMIEVQRIGHISERAILPIRVWLWICFRRLLCEHSASCTQQQEKKHCGPHHRCFLSTSDSNRSRQCAPRTSRGMVRKSRIVPKRCTECPCQTAPVNQAIAVNNDPSTPAQTPPQKPKAAEQVFNVQ